MKITCHCGALIHDGTDGLAHKAHLIADRDWNPFWDAVDAALEKGRAPDEAAMALRRAARSRQVWECPECGRLWIDAGDGTLLSYAAENGRVNKVLAR